MKSRFWLIIATFAICLLLSGMIPSNPQATIRVTTKAEPATTVVTLPQECAQCENKCREEALKECYEQNEKSAKELESPGQQ